MDCFFLGVNFSGIFLLKSRLRTVASTSKPTTATNAVIASKLPTNELAFSNEFFSGKLITFASLMIGQ